MHCFIDRYRAFLRQIGVSGAMPHRADPPTTAREVLDRLKRHLTGTLRAWAIQAARSIPLCDPGLKIGMGRAPVVTLDEMNHHGRLSIGVEHRDWWVTVTYALVIARTRLADRPWHDC